MPTTTTHHSSFPYGSLLVPVVMVVIALLASAVLVSAIAKDPDPVAGSAENTVELPASDSGITTRVKSEILANTAFRVRVKTRSGIVFLKGKLPSREAVEQVMTIAEKIKGVRGVDASGLVINN